MRVRWTTNAADDLKRIVEHIRKDNPAAAQRTAQTIYKGIAALRTMPARGRVGRLENTRELVVTPLPYIAITRLQKTKCRCSVSATLLKIGHKPARDRPLPGRNR